NSAGLRALGVSGGVLIAGVYSVDRRKTRKEERPCRAALPVPAGLSRCRCSAPALLQALFGRDRWHARDRMVGDQRDAGVEELQARRRLRLLAGPGVVDHGLDP